MKIIHTADWHIGQNFYEYDRRAEHLGFFEWLKATLKKLDTDVLLIAGDIFDSPNPSAESQKIYYSFLRSITNENPRLQIIIIAGNHDSAARLEAPNPLLEGMNITVRGIIKRTPEGDIDIEHLIVPLNGGGYCLAVPYLRQGDYPDAENYSKSVKAMYDKLYESACSRMFGKSVDAVAAERYEKQGDSGTESAPIIAMGHLQTTGSGISENDRSERTIIGGLECVSSEAFSDGIAYTALGHLHRGQRVSGRDNVRYSGTPVPMSFAEKNNKQGVVFVEINDNKTCVEFLEFKDTVKLISVPKEPMALNDVLDEIMLLPDGDINDSSPYLEINVLITEPEPSMRHQIEEALKGKSVRLARISAVTKEYISDSRPVTYEELQTINPMDMAEKIFEQQYGGEKMPDTMKNLLFKVIQEVGR